MRTLFEDFDNILRLKILCASRLDHVLNDGDNFNCFAHDGGRESLDDLLAVGLD